jgi:adenylate cyclase
MTTSLQNHAFRRFYAILCFALCWIAAFEQPKLYAQTPAALETQANQSNDRKEKMNLLYQSAEKFLGSDAQKASDNAHGAYNIAEELGDQVMMARAAYLNAEGFARRSDYTGARVRYSRAKGHAANINDVDFVIKCLVKMSEVSRRQGDAKAAANYATEAAELKRGKSGGAVASTGGKTNPTPTPNASSTPAQSAQQAAALREKQREIEQIQREKQRYAAELEQKQKELDRMNAGINNLQRTQQQLSSESQQAKQTIETQSMQLEAISGQKVEVEKVAARRAKLLEAMQNGKSLDSLAYAQEVQEQETRIQKETNLRNVLLLVLGFAFVIVGLIYRRFLENKKQRVILEEKNKMIQDERERSDELLLNILPSPIATELKEKGRAAARRYENASVMFTDFRNFTTISERLSPEELVSELDTYFKAFDFIVAQYKIEKIKTIGDAYMCASGLSDRVSTPVNIVKAALEMQQYVNEVKAEKIAANEPYFDLKIGINTGPVVAGVVGVNKFAYDIWGDTVNIASRMEQNCEPGQVNISETTYWAVKYNFKCLHRGKIDAKNKGQIDMYYIQGII